MGSMVLVRFEASDVERVFADFAQSNDAFDVWFKQRVSEVSGVNLSAPMEGPLPEMIFSWP